MTWGDTSMEPPRLSAQRMDPQADAVEPPIIVLEEDELEHVYTSIDEAVANQNNNPTTHQKLHPPNNNDPNHATNKNDPLLEGGVNVNVDGAAGLLTLPSDQLGRSPASHMCPFCSNDAELTKTKDRPNIVTILFIFILLLVFWPISWIPLVTPQVRIFLHFRISFIETLI